MSSVRVAHGYLEGAAKHSALYNFDSSGRDLYNYAYGWDFGGGLGPSFRVQRERLTLRVTVLLSIQRCDEAMLTDHYKHYKLMGLTLHSFASSSAKLHAIA